MNEGLLEFANVSKKYRGQGVALDGISFKITPGELTALAGPSGSGKSTILLLAAGLDAPTTGKIHLEGKAVHRLKAPALAELRRRTLGFVFQSYNLFPVLTALENVEYPLALLRIGKKERRERSRQALADVGLSGLEKRLPKDLSGGQQQRVAVARAIVSKPKLVLADEPTANLDSKSAEQLIELFGELNSTSGATFLFSSHDPRVLEFARRVISIRDGKIE